MKVVSLSEVLNKSNGMPGLWLYTAFTSSIT